MKIRHFLITTAILLVIMVVFGAAAFGLNFITGPIIAEKSAGAANERLDAVMPEGDKAYEDITATLTLPEKLISPANGKRTADIIAVHKETNGLGYVVEVAWTSEDSHGNEPNLVLVGISPDGKIIKINNEAYHDTANYNIFNNDPNYAATFEGQDSTLADVGLVAGSTHSSTAFRSAVAHAFEVLVINDLITAGKKSDAQVLEELIPSVAPGYSKLLEVEVSGNIQKALKAENDTGFAYIMTEGDASYLAVVNAMGGCKIYDVEGADVTAAHAALADEAKAHAVANQTAYFDSFKTQIEAMMPGAIELQPVVLDTFNTVVSSVSFNVEGATYYGFYSRSYGFDQMDVFVIIDENGAIAKTDAKQFIFHEDSFLEYPPHNAPTGPYVGMPNGYVNGFEGVTGDWNGDAAFIAGATMSTNAIKQSVNDAFAAFNSIKGGEQ